MRMKTHLIFSFGSASEPSSPGESFASTSGSQSDVSGSFEGITIQKGLILVSGCPQKSRIKGLEIAPASSLGNLFEDLDDLPTPKH